MTEEIRKNRKGRIRRERSSKTTKRTNQREDKNGIGNTWQKHL